MRTTINIEDDALLVAKRHAERTKVPLGAAVSQLIRHGAQQVIAAPVRGQRLRGRFALLPARDEVITPEHVRELMEREGI